MAFRTRIGAADAITAGGYTHLAALIAVGTAATLLAVASANYLARGPGWLAAELPSLGLSHLILAGVGVICIAVALQRPSAGLLMLAALLYTNASEIAVLRYGVPSPLQALSLATALGAIARLSFRRDSAQGLILDPLLLLLAVYAFVIFLSSLGAVSISAADGSLQEHFKGVLLFLLVTNLVTSQRALRTVVWVIVLSAAFLGTISVYQVLSGSYEQDFGGFGLVRVLQIVDEIRQPRVAGSLGDPNFYAQVLVVAVPLALYRLWDERSPRLKPVAGYALAVIALAAVFTYSRGGALALGVVLLLALLHKRVATKYFLLGLLALAPLWLLVPQTVEGRLGTLGQLAAGSQEEAVLSEEDASFGHRRLLMASAWEMFADHTLIGVGAGNYSEHYKEYSAELGTTLLSYEKFGQRQYPHNLYLEIAAETGIAGLFAFFSIVVGAFASLWIAFRSFTRIGATRSANMTVSIGLALVAYLATSLFLHGEYIRYFWLLVALAVAAKQIARRVTAGDGDV